jgi:hypothetical protein
MNVLLTSAAGRRISANYALRESVRASCTLGIIYVLRLLEPRNREAVVSVNVGF